MRNLSTLCVGMFVIFLAGVAHATTWRVVPAGGGDATTLQTGIDLAQPGDVVLVAPGTYAGEGNVNLIVSGKDITVTTEGGAQQTIIDCANSSRAFIFFGDSSTVEGFTIRNGSAGMGGAIYSLSASPTIRYCVFSGNSATSQGGALYVQEGAPVFYNNTFHGCSAPAGATVWFQGPAFPQFYQNIVCESGVGAAFGCGGSPYAFVACNDLYGNSGGSFPCGGNNGNNFSTDPLFCGIPGSGNFYLQQTSPCSANFSPCGASIGAFGTLCEVTATESVTWGKVKSMYR
jgi:predicted outer membrane repeat protein